MAILTMLAGGRRGQTALGPRVAWLCGLFLLGFAAPAVAAEPAPSAEYQLKAVFLFNFAQFVEWPAQAYRDAKAPLVIGVLGEDPFGAFLDRLVRGEKVGDRPLIVRRFRRVEDIAECHILFISRSEAATLGQVIAHLKGRSLLTVSDVDTFTRQGGIVRFVTENGKIRLRINVEAAKRCELTISSKILRPAMIVTADND
jgi:YfiR/HmsC-like